jgi:hypothetical protein
VIPFVRRRTAAGLTLAALLLGLAGCAQTFDARTLGARTTLAARASSQPSGDEFKVTRSAVYLLWGIGVASRPSLERVLAGQLKGGEEIANLRISVRSTFGDGLVSLLTLGLVVPRTVTFEGVIVPPSTLTAPSPTAPTQTPPSPTPTTPLPR